MIKVVMAAVMTGVGLGGMLGLGMAFLGYMMRNDGKDGRR